MSIPIVKLGKGSVVLVQQGGKIVALSREEAPKLFSKMDKLLSRPNLTSSIGKPSTYGEIVDSVSRVSTTIGPKSNWQKFKEIIAILGQSF